jgi:hypothetical protein
MTSDAAKFSTAPTQATPFVDKLLAALRQKPAQSTGTAHIFSHSQRQFFNTPL